MRSELLLGVLAVGVMLVGQAANAGDGGAGALQGVWGVVAGEKAGVKAPEKDARSMTVEIGPDSLTFVRGDRRETFKIVVNPAVTPHQIDLTGEDGTSRPGIYELKGDTLKLALAATGERPGDFTSSPGTKSAVMVLERKGK